jgi:REP element-mobilizing transposase RayT
MLDKKAASRVSRYLSEYAEMKSVYMKINHVNADHVHALVDLPTGFSIEELMQLLKGSSSHWINANNLVVGKFAWGRGYGALLCIGIKCRSGRRVYRWAGTTPSDAHVRRRIAGVHRATRVAVER